MLNIFDDDINDNEIRIIGSARSKKSGNPNKRNGRKPCCFRINDSQDESCDSGNRPKRPIWIWVLAVAIVALVVYLIMSFSNSTDRTLQVSVVDKEEIAPDDSLPIHPVSISCSDTVIDGFKLKLIRPERCLAELFIGDNPNADKSIKLAVPAADIRADNGNMVGAYVYRGELLSQGKSKMGFCAIIDGAINIGMAENTPLFEKATETGGYFFRQYPLVAEYQPIALKPKGSRLRKALAEIDGCIVIVMSVDTMTLGQFADALVSLGATNAINLVGSNSYAFMRGNDGSLTEFGSRDSAPHPNTNYIIWRSR